MGKTLTIAKREIDSLFFSPVAYLALAVFAFVTGLIFIFGVFSPGMEASMTDMYRGIVWLLAFIVPAISMRLISEETSAGTLEMLLTAPVNDTQIILGKWIGAMAFFFVLLIPLIIQIGLLELKASPDYGPIITGLFGLLLVGGLYMAVGICISAFNKSQLVSFMITVLITGLFTVGMYLLSRAEFMPNWLKQNMYSMNVNEHFLAFAKGLIDIRDIVYFVSSIALFLFLGIKALESKRWS